MIDGADECVADGRRLGWAGVFYPTVVQNKSVQKLAAIYIVKACENREDLVGGVHVLAVDHRLVFLEQMASDGVTKSLNEKVLRAYVCKSRKYDVEHLGRLCLKLRLRLRFRFRLRLKVMLRLNPKISWFVDFGQATFV